jgi:hypothetical protein
MEEPGRRHTKKKNKALFRCHPNSKFFHSLSITSIFSRLHGVLNVGKKQLITQFSWKSRDESFEPSWSTIGQYLPNKTKAVLFIRFNFFCKVNKAQVRCCLQHQTCPVAWDGSPGLSCVQRTGAAMPHRSCSSSSGIPCSCSSSWSWPQGTGPSTRLGTVLQRSTTASNN